LITNLYEYFVYFVAADVSISLLAAIIPPKMDTGSES